MIILVVNAGSSSLKYQLFNMEDTRATAMAAGVFERIGDSTGAWTHKTSLAGHKEKIVKQIEIKDHRIAMHHAIRMIADPRKGVIKDTTLIDAVGHRVVQGGEAFGSAVIIDASVKMAVRDHHPLAPLHNPANLTGIEVAEELLPDIPNIAVFDTQFHQTMPPKAFLYGLPYKFYTQHRVRRYGFHGTSHKYISLQAAKLLNREIEAVNLITLHLGNGCSVCAIEKGRCIDTSMGMTPLAGVMMGTRTGDIDPAVIRYLIKETKTTIDDLETIFNNESGLKGICGLNDMRDIHESMAKGDKKAGLAIDMFCYQVKKYIGAYTAALGNVDAIVFSGGVGENDAVIREKICKNLSGIGVCLDRTKNLSRPPRPFSLHSADSAVDIWVVSTDEEFQIATEVVKILEDS